MSSNATLTTTVVASLPDNGSDSLVFTLISSVAIASSTLEIEAGNTFTMALDANGDGSIDLPVPDNTGDGAWLWQVLLPDEREPYFTLAYDASDQDLAELLAAAASTAVPSDLAGVYVPLAGGTMTGALVLSGAPTADLQAASKLYVDTADDALVDKNAAIISKNATYQLAAGDEAKVIECDGTFTVTCPNGLDAGFQVVIVNVGSGTITLSAATTLQSKDGASQLANQYGAATVYHRGSDVWLAFGDLS